MMPASRWARRQHHTLLRPALSPRRPASPPPFSPLRRRLQAAKLSSFQLEVSEALGALGIDHELEYLTAVNLLSVDIAIVAGGEACVCGGGGDQAACLHVLLRSVLEGPCRQGRWPRAGVCSRC